MECATCSKAYAGKDRDNCLTSYQPRSSPVSDYMAFEIRSLVKLWNTARKVYKCDNSKPLFQIRLKNPKEPQNM